MRCVLRLMITLGVILLTGCQRAEVKVPTTPPQDFVTTSTAENFQSQQLAAFVDHNFVQHAGVLTSLGGAKVGADDASGADYLAESMGLWLLHLVQIKQYAAFRQFYAAGKAKLYNGQNFAYRLSRPSDQRSAVNASADDLRIMRALIAYDQATASTRYQKAVATLYANWAKGCLPNGQLRDFYDVRHHQASGQVSLAYVDLQTLRYLGGNTKAYRQLLAVVQHGYLGDAFPLYAASYNWHDVAYSSQHLNTSEALETVLQLARVGHLKATTKAWLIQRVQKQDLPNAMTTTGAIVDADRSVANWALVAQIFATIHDRRHYDQTMALIWAQQLKSGPLKGGFGDAKTGKAFSYNNLNVLLAADLRRQAHE